MSHEYYWQSVRQSVLDTFVDDVAMQLDKETGFETNNASMTLDADATAFGTPAL